jgi:hypothetical protein
MVTFADRGYTTGGRMTITRYHEATEYQS